VSAQLIKALANNPYFLAEELSKSIDRRTKAVGESLDRLERLLADSEQRMIEKGFYTALYRQRREEGLA
jgi:predicted transcriptional regulator